MASDEAVPVAKVDAELTPPPLICRWVHGGPPLDDLTSIPLASTGAASANAPPSVWRDFTDKENARLEAAWQQLDEETREKAWTSKVKAATTGTSSGKSSAASSRRSSMVQERPQQIHDDPAEVPEEAQDQAQQGYIADPEQESQSHIVYVSQDNLFSADLKTLSLYPVFWKGARIGIQRATWFYPSVSLNKFYPVDPLLSFYLEEAYDEIKPYAPSYAEELRSAVEIGAEAEAKLKHVLSEVGVDVIFQGPDSARLYARNLGGRLSKSFLTSFLRDKSHSGGGTLIYRGYDTLLAHSAASGKASKVKTSLEQRTDSLKQAQSLTKQEATSDSESETIGLDGTKKGKKTAKESKAPSRLSNLFSLSYGGGKLSTSSGDSREQSDENTTAEAMEHSKEDEEGGEPELAELVLIIHGIGQKLAVTYDSFNIVHAINQMRKICNHQARDATMRAAIGNKRLQFIPLQWRSSIQFEEMPDDDDTDPETQLDNRFTINDIQIQGAIPFVQSLVTGVGLDLAFYLSRHRERMISTVIRDANRIYRLFKQRNPNFNGKVSILAHSLGTALATDILSRQPTLVPDWGQMTATQKHSDDHFVFNVSTVFFVGSPVGYMFFLNKGQLVARSGRARTKAAPKEIALDKVGKYGCLAVDSVYNVFNVLDPVACCLNACVDADYAKVVKPLPINSVTSSILSEYTAKVSSFLGSLLPSWPSSSSSKPETKAEDPSHATKFPQDDAQGAKSPEQAMQRPKTKRQLTSELNSEELKRFERAERRMLALNPQGSIDFYLSGEGFSAYYDMLISHASYWTDARFVTFVLTQLLATPEALEKSKEKREEAEQKEAEAEQNKAGKSQK